MTIPPPENRPRSRRADRPQIPPRKPRQGELISAELISAELTSTEAAERDSAEQPGPKANAHAKRNAHAKPKAKSRARSMRSEAIMRMYPATANAHPHEAELHVVGLINRTLFLIAVLLSLRYVLPTVVEEVQYAITSGRQRAEYDRAGEQLQNASLNSLTQAYQQVFQRVVPSVVHIETRNEGDPDSDAGSITMGGMRAPTNRGQGSGVIVSEDGYLLTNYHVIKGFNRITVKLSDGRCLTGRKVGEDKLTDLALLKIDCDGLAAAEWGDSDTLEEGAPVWAVGSPFGFQHSITSGILSAKNRGSAGTPHQNFLQTDAAVNPGNSGGPLADSQGRVVGINTMIVGHAFQGVSLAIPCNIAKSVYERLRDEGIVVRGWLGVSRRTLTSEDEAEFGIGHGAVIEQIQHTAKQTSPAYQAGLRIGDVIVKWGDTEIATGEQLSRVIAATPVDTEVKVLAIHQGRPIAVTVRVGQRPPQSL